MADLFNQSFAKTVALEKLKVFAQGRVPQSMLMEMGIESYFDVVANELVYRLESAVLQLKDAAVYDSRVIYRPTDWWQAFKQRWFPSFLLKRYPVERESIVVGTTTLTRICPHLESDPQHHHVRFFVHEPKDIDRYIEQERESRKRELFEAGYRAAMNRCPDPWDEFRCALAKEMARG